MKSTALKESIMRSLGRGQERPLAEVHSYVKNDYGEVSTRSVLRYLDMLVSEGKIMRSGVHGHRIYAAVREVTNASRAHAPAFMQQAR